MVVFSVARRLRAEESLRESEQRWKFALEGAGHGVWDWNIQTGELFLSKQEMTVLGYDGEGALHTYIDQWVDKQHPDDRNERKEAMESYFAGHSPIYSCEFRTKARDGSWIWIFARGMLVSQTRDKKPLRMIGTHTDITERKLAEDQLRNLATKDPLTGVINRRVFIEKFEEEFLRFKRTGRQSALLMLDADHLKRVNDTYGHQVGDAVLQNIAKISTESLRRTDHFGRLGGEEFAFLLPETDLIGARIFASRVCQLIAESTVHTASEEISVTVSIGLALTHSDDVDIEDIINRCDKALYRAKMNGRNRIETDLDEIEIISN